MARLVPALRGLDGIVFTAGMGEDSALVRRLICERPGWLGVAFDAAANQSGAMRIGSKGSDVDVLVIPTDEESVIAETTRNLVPCGAAS